MKAIYPVHLNPAVQEEAERVFGNHERIHLMEPLGVLDFHNFMKASYLILTDSGGIQEEAPGLGKPVLVMRDTPGRHRSRHIKADRNRGRCDLPCFYRLAG